MKRLTFVFALGVLVALISVVPVTAANSLVVTTAAALGGTTNGLSIIAENGATNLVYVRSNHASDESHLLMRFRVRVDGLNAPGVGAGRNFRLLNINDDSLGTHKVIFLQRQNATVSPPGNWRVIAWTLTNSNTWEGVGSGFFLANYHGAIDRQIECEWQQATAGPNGSFGCKRTDQPGSQFFLRTNISDSNFEGDQVEVGLFDYDNFPGAAATGQLDFDEFELYR